jgi:hypothetical protein
MLNYEGPKHTIEKIETKFCYSRIGCLAKGRVFLNQNQVTPWEMGTSLSLILACTLDVL